MTPEKELEALIVTKLAAALPAGVQAVRKQQITTAATLPRVSVACDVSTDNQALAQVGVFSVSVEVTAMFDAITGSDPATTIQSTIDAIDETILDWPVLFDDKVICMGGTFGAGSTTNDEDRLVRTISGTLWARRRVVVPGVPTGNMIVSGAGSVEVNGRYLPNGFELESNKPKFILENGASQLLYEFTNGLWILGPFGLYNSPDDVASPDLAVWVVDAGQAPAPTVTAELGPPTII
jgi:hypothetical protein